jgi:hypothetical protein
MSAANAARFNFSEILATVQNFNLIVEAQWAFTAAEFRLAAILVKKGAHREDVSITAKNWEEWTGLDPKSRDVAIRGLKQKGFHVSGRGNKAKFRFDSDELRRYWRSADRAVRPKTEQKRTPAKPGQMIHPACRENGCEMARQAEAVESNLISIDAARPSAALASDSYSAPGLDLGSDSATPSVTSAADSRAASTEKSTEELWNDLPTMTSSTNPSTKISSRILKTTMRTKTTSVPSAAPDSTKSTTKIVPNPTTTISNSPAPSPNQAVEENQPRKDKVSTSPGEKAGRSSACDDKAARHINPQDWPLTLTAMTQRFLTAGLNFLARLLPEVQKRSADIQDLELSQAIAAATKKNQHSEALWLRTVPECVENIRREKKKETDRLEAVEKAEAEWIKKEEARLAALEAKHEAKRYD